MGKNFLFQPGIMGKCFGIVLGGWVGIGGDLGGGSWNGIGIWRILAIFAFQT